MRTKFYAVLFFFVLFHFGFSQEPNESQNATLTVVAQYVKVIPSIADQMASGQFMPAQKINKEYNPKRRGANKAVPGKGFPKGDDPLWNKDQSITKIKGKEPLISWITLNDANATPTDPTGAVGPNHFVNAWNSGFRIWDKEGNPLTDEASLSTLFPGETFGDPIVIYDRYADRFLITEFSDSPNGFLVAVCQGSDPVNDGWFTYRFNSGTFPDYPKYSVWSDGYYITSNKDSDSPGSSEVVFAIERDKMLTGDASALMVGFPLTDIVVSGFYSPLSFNANGSTPPEPGNVPVVYMQDDAWSGVSEDHLKIWSINVDWDTPANSTISSPQIIPTAPFDGLFDGGSFSNLPQGSGPDIDALQATIMFMAQYRRFGSYNAVVFNFVVDLDGSDDYAGIRWYELRQNNSGDPWAIYQEGTYVQPEGHSAFCGSMAMDASGNIGLGYTVVSTVQSPSIRYTGRMANDPLGEMTFEEDIIEAGAQDDPSFRYGDYGQLTIDPTNDKTFWHTAEFFAGGNRKNVVGAFQLAPNFDDDVGVVSLIEPSNGTLTDSEPVTVTIRNFGLNDASDVPVSYQVDGGAVVSETAVGTIASGEDMLYTFSVTADLSIVGQTYNIMAATAYPGDMDTGNDTINVQVTHLEPNDLGVSAITSPVSGTDLTGAELITVTINNYGGEPQSDFDVSYILDGGAVVTEQIPGPLAQISAMTYTFATTGDFSTIGNHELAAFTSLAGDSDHSNDTTSVTITKNFCQPVLNCGAGDGFQLFQLGTIDNPSGCEGYGDFTDLSTDLNFGIPYDLTVTTGYGNQFVRVWIDFNDNFVFELDEIVIDNVEIADGQGAGSYTETMTFTIPNAISGAHILRAKSHWNSPVPDDACDDAGDGETEDYTVVIVEPTLDLDVGIISIDNPNDGVLSDNEVITVSIGNFGINDVSDVPVSYQIDGGAMVNEVFPGTIPSASGVQYSFSVTADMSELGTYSILASTALNGDENPDNDQMLKLVTNEINICQPDINCTLGDGFRQFNVGTIDNFTDCEPDGYGDFTFLSTTLDTGSTNELTVTTGYGNQFIRVWIDYNDNYLFELDELVVDNYEIADGESSGTYTETMDLVVPADAALGEHLMRAKSNWNNPVPDDACEETSFGETEDYTAIIDYAVGITEQALLNEELKIAYLPGDHYKITLTISNIKERLILTVHDVTGHKLVQNWVENQGGSYEYELDMSHAPAGVYLVRLGTESFGKVKRIVVK